MHLRGVELLNPGFDETVLRLLDGHQGRSRLIASHGIQRLFIQGIPYAVSKCAVLFPVGAPQNPAVGYSTAD